MTTHDIKRISWPFLVALGIFASFSILILIPKFPPLLYDFPDWVYQSVLLRDWLQGHPHPDYLLKPYPVPFSAMIYFIGGLSLVIPWTLAAKLLWIATGGFAIFAVSYFLRASGQRDLRVWLIVPTFVLINQTWWWGASGFLMGLPLEFLGAGFFLRGKVDAAHWIPLTLAAFFIHGLHLIVLGMLTCVEAVRTRSIRPLLYLVPAGLLSVAYLYGRYVVLHNAETMHYNPGFAFLSLMFLFFKINGLAKSMGFANPLGVGGPVLVHWFGPYGLAALEVLVSISALAAWSLLIPRAWQAWTDKIGNERERLLWGLLAVLVFIFLICPTTFLDVSDFGQRMLEIALAIGLCLAFRFNWVGKILCFISVAFVCLNLTLIGALSDNPAPTGAPAPMLGPMARFSAMNYTQRYNYYQAIETGRMNLIVFPTALFLKKQP